MQSNPENTEPKTVRPRLTAILFADEPYAEFNRHMDEELARLVEHWQHLASPNARRITQNTINSRRNAV